MFQCDLRNEGEIYKMFEWISEEPNLGKTDICISNAGFSFSQTLLEGA
jgi:NAD(P)-dependent dehydrogenase (short-subunit alcohol dehydrogenase family)